MTVKPSPSVVGVFSDRSLAEQAIEALQASGFHNEDISYSAPGSTGGFFQDLKSLFTGTSPGGGHLTSDLTAMGLPDEEARYYADQYNSGNAVLAVKAGDREQDVLSVLHRYGAYHARTSSGFSGESPEYGQPPSEMIHPEGYASPEQASDANVQSWESAQPQTVEEEAYPQPQTDVEPDERNAEDIEHQPQAETTSAEPDVESKVEDIEEYRQPETTVEPDIEETEYKTDQPVKSDYDTEPDLTQQDEDTFEEEEAQMAPEVVKEYDTEPELQQTDVTEHESQVMPETEEGVAQTPESVAPEHGTGYQAPTYTVTQTTGVSYEHTDQLRLLQNQLKNAQQQLQEAKAKLQKAKEHEQELQSVRRQLEEVQKELEATMSELNETQNRLTNYK